MRTARFYAEILRWNLQVKNQKFIFLNFHFLFRQHCPVVVSQHKLATTFSGSLLPFC